MAPPVVSCQALRPQALRYYRTAMRPPDFRILLPRFHAGLREAEDDVGAES